MTNPIMTMRCAIFALAVIACGDRASATWAVPSDLPAAAAPQGLPFENRLGDVAPRGPAAAAGEAMPPKDKDHPSIATPPGTTAEIEFRWLGAAAAAAARLSEAQGADTGQGRADGAPTARGLVALTNPVQVGAAIAGPDVFVSTSATEGLNFAGRMFTNGYTGSTPCSKGGCAGLSYMTRVDMDAAGTIVVGGGDRYADDNFVMKTYDAARGSWVDRGSAGFRTIGSTTSNGESRYSKPYPSISGDGNRLDLRTRNDNRVYTWDPEREDYTSSVHFGRPYPYCKQISKDGSAFLVVEGDQATPGLTGVITEPQNHVSSNGVVRIYRNDGTNWIVEMSTSWSGGQGIDNCSLSADGNRAGWGARTGTNGIWFHQKNAATGNWEAASLPINYCGGGGTVNNARVDGFTITPDGNKVFTRCYNGSGSSVDIFDWGIDSTALTMSTQTIPNHYGRHVYYVRGAHAIGASHDGGRVAINSAQGGHVKVFEVAGEGPYTEVASFDLTVANLNYRNGAALNCDGSVVAFGDGNAIQVHRLGATDISSCPASCLGVAVPSQQPSASRASTNTPTDVPTNAPTTVPTAAPTDAPTNAPTDASTNAPTYAPTNAPTNTPTNAPTGGPCEDHTECAPGEKCKGGYKVAKKCRQKKKSCKRFGTHSGKRWGCAEGKTCGGGDPTAKWGSCVSG